MNTEKLVSSQLGNVQQNNTQKNNARHRNNTQHHSHSGFSSLSQSPQWHEDTLINAYQQYSRPDLTAFLKALSLDGVYTKAKGNYLWQQQAGQLLPILDFVGGYGANLLGHNHPVLVAELQQLLHRNVPVLAQGSCRVGAALLAQALSDRLSHLGDYMVCLTNSGTETVEAALKHALMERQRSIIWAVKGAFHGKTLGSIQLTWAYKDPFTDMGPQVHFLDPEDAETWKAVTPEVSQVAAIFIEPILGEGGIRPLPAPFVKWLLRVQQMTSIPIIADEIQTGMGRTGKFLACETLGIKPDYVCLSKSLGGGLTKVGALLIQRRRFVPEFGLKQTSTFAEDDLSSFIALKVLQLIEQDQLLDRCTKMGTYLLTRLEELRDRYPHCIKEARGQGLMIGIELQNLLDSPSNLLRVFSQQETLGGVAAAYFLNVHHIRIMPTLSSPFTLRLEPSAYITQAECDRFLQALDTFCQALQACDIRHLTGFHVGLPPSPVQDYSLPRPFAYELPRTTRRVAFLGHLVSAQSTVAWDPAFQAFQPQERELYLDKLAAISQPGIFDQVNVRSQTGEEVHLSIIALSLTSQQIQAALQQGDVQWLMEKIEAGVGLAKSIDCQVIGLGGYTSIVSLNCQDIKTSGIALTSGNSLTVGMGIRAMRAAAQQQGIDLSQAKLAIVGASGNIASTYATMMAPWVQEVILIARFPNSPRLREIKDTIQQIAPDVAVEVTNNLDSLKSCSLILTASNSASPLVYPEHLSTAPGVILDIAVPADVAANVLIDRPNYLVIQGGVVRLPYNPTLVVSGLSLSPGHIYACMAETLLMGLEGMTTHGSYGMVTPAGVERMLAIADQHGFQLGEFKQERSY